MWDENIRRVREIEQSRRKRLESVLAHHRLKVCPEPQSTVIYFLVVGKHVCKCNNGVSFLLRHAYWLDECLKRASNISARNLTGVCARFCASLGGLEYFVLTRAKHLSMTGRRLLNTEGGRAKPGAQRISLCRVKHDSTRPGEGEGFWRVIVAVDWTSLWTFTRDTEREREREMVFVMASKWLLCFCLLWLCVTSKKLLNTCIQKSLFFLCFVVFVLWFVKYSENKHAVFFCYWHW